MSVIVVVGGQFGSEGKGKVIAHLAMKSEVPVMGIRCGGPNAGHTIYVDGAPIVTRHVSSAVVNPRAIISIPAGGMVDPGLLSSELDALRGIIGNRHLLIDHQTAIVDSADKEAEVDMKVSIGSTGTGTGGCQQRRVMRVARIAAWEDVVGSASASGDKFWATAAATISAARGISPSDVYRGCELAHVSAVARAVDKKGGLVLVEGTQGFGLSNYHGTYPYCTSKCTTASHFLSEAGLPPKATVIGVFRRYPIRVGGNSGPFNNEITWEIVRERSGYTTDLTEKTSVTRKVRRVAEWDSKMYCESVEMNGITQVALHGADHIDASVRGATTRGDLSQAVWDWVDMMNKLTSARVRWVYTGPAQDHIVEVE